MDENYRLYISILRVKHVFGAKHGGTTQIQVIFIHFKLCIAEGDPQLEVDENSRIYLRILRVKHVFNAKHIIFTCIF